MTHPEPPAGVVAAEEPVTLGGLQGALPVLWWVPTDRPVTGVAWLQHGYARKPQHMAGIARALTASGLLVAMPTVESFRRARSINDKQYLDAIGRSLATLAEDDSALHRAVAHAGVTVPAEALERLVLVAHSAGCAVAARAAGEALRHRAPLRGIVVLDATENLAKTFGPSLPDLTGTPVLGVFARPSRCNRKGQGAVALRDSREGFVGVRLTTGTHCDAEGAETDRVCRTMCGAPDPANVALLREIAATWAADLATGGATPDWRPHGERLAAEVEAGRVAVL